MTTHLNVFLTPINPKRSFKTSGETPRATPKKLSHGLIVTN